MKVRVRVCTAATKEYVGTHGSHPEQWAVDDVSSVATPNRPMSPAQPCHEALTASREQYAVLAACPWTHEPRKPVPAPSAALPGEGEIPWWLTAEGLVSGGCCRGCHTGRRSAVCPGRSLLLHLPLVCNGRSRRSTLRPFAEVVGSSTGQNLQRRNYQMKNPNLIRP